MELDGGTAGGELVRVDAAAEIVHEQFDVELVVVHESAGPAGSPFAESHDDGGEFAPGGGEEVLGVALALGLLLDEQASFLELLESLGEEGGRHLGESALQVVEAGFAEQEFADEEESPAFADDFGGFGDGAELAVLDAHGLTTVFVVSCYILCRGWQTRFAIEWEASKGATVAAETGNNKPRS